EGTGWMLKMADRIRRGQGRAEDLKILEEVGHSIGIMPGTTICGLADGAGWPVKTAIRKFRGEVEEYLRSGKKSHEPALAAAHYLATRGIDAMRIGTRLSVGMIALAAVLVLAGPSPRAEPARGARDLPKVKNDFKRLALAFHDFFDTHNRGPANVEQLAPFYD